MDKIATNGSLIAASAFQSVGNSGYSRAQIPLTASTEYTFSSIDGSSFGVLSYGWAIYDAYSHPLGMRLDDTSGACNSGVPAVPINLGVRAVSSARIDLHWTDGSDNETGFVVQRALSATGTWVEIGRTGAGQSYFTDLAATPSTTYFYRVASTNNTGASGWSNVASATTFAAGGGGNGTGLVAPSDLKAEAVSASRINLTWQDNSDNESGFRVERAIIANEIGNIGPWSEVGTVGLGVTTFGNGTLQPNTVYAYRVRAYNTSGTPSYSNTASATTFINGGAVDIPSPTNLTAVAVSPFRINLQW